jgi:hypothetical protein
MLQNMTLFTVNCTLHWILLYLVSCILRQNIVALCGRTVHTRKYITKRIWDKFLNSPKMYPTAQDKVNLPPYRLKSRKPLWKEEFLMQPFSTSDYWKAARQDVNIFTYYIPSAKLFC